MNRNSRNLLIILKTIGVEQFTEIAKQLSGECVVFNCYTAQGYTSKEDRDKDILEDFYSGKLSNLELAEKYNLSINSIYKIVEHHNSGEKI